MYATIIIINIINAMVQIKVTQLMRQAASVMNLNPHVPHMYFGFIMHSMVNHTYTTWTSAKRDGVRYLARWFNVPVLGLDRSILTLRRKTGNKHHI